MKEFNSKLVLPFIIIWLFMFISACNQENSLLESELDRNPDVETIKKIIEEDESLETFDLNYNEEEAMDFVLGKKTEELFPLKVGQKMKLVDKALEVEFNGDTAYATLTKTFDGVLFIIASRDSLSNFWNTKDLNLYKKLFTTTIKRNIILVKKEGADSSIINWKLKSTSLPVGGTLTENIKIEKVKVYLPDGKVIEVDDPLNYYLARDFSFREIVPIIKQQEEIKVEVTIKSAYKELDFVTFTRGAIRGRKHLRNKKRFEFVEGSEIFDGTYYHRTFVGNWQVNQFIGHKHVVINAIPWGVIKDSKAPVESSTWGIPYSVK